MLDPNLDWSELGLQRIYENMQADGVIPAERKFELGHGDRRRILRAVQGSAAGQVSEPKRHWRSANCGGAPRYRHIIWPVSG